MPLSKQRDKERKRLEKQETDRIRLEKLASSPQTSKLVQPNDVLIAGVGKAYAQIVDICIRESLDDDGHPIPDV